MLTQAAPMRALPALLLAAAAAAAACGSHTAPTAVATAEPPRPSAPVDDTPTAPAKPITMKSLTAIGLDPGALDRTSDPCDDFFQFACGGWIQRTQIAADRTEQMRVFEAIIDHNLAYEHTLLEGLRGQASQDVTHQQLAAFYASCMDEPAIERAGLAPLRPALAVIDQVKDPRSLTAALASLHAAGFDPLFTLGPRQDAADAVHVIARLEQGGLGLPDRDYYLATDAASAAARTAYLAFAEAALTAIGRPTAVARREAADVLALETTLARLSKDKVTRRDPHGNYNKIDRAGVARAVPHLDWDAYWAGVGLRHVQSVVVDAPGFFAGLDPLVTATPAATWRAYLAVQVLHQAAPFAARALEEPAFALDSALSGQPELPPRWKRCVQHTERALGELIGQAFVHDRLSAASRAAAEDAIHAVVAAMTTNLETLPWMDDTTRARAREKLAAMTYQIGGPRRWRTYPIKLDARTWTANMLAARRAERARLLAQIDHPVDRDAWKITPVAVNAYYDDQINSMVFPAGILQPPLYAVEAALAVNLGGLGMVVGHELTHGFDDQGAQYDAAGNLANWWQADTAAQFAARTKCVIDQYAAYEVAGGTKLDGAHTVGENIADIGGVKLAFAAYRALRATAADSVVADGFTEDQQFFLGFGQAWCAVQRPDFERWSVAVDDHATPRWRVNGSLAATPEFARAFHCRTGARLAPAAPCVVW
ncbi:MAG TPA: M13 family metallopeptidase [Kofleriaceae bacterium]|nr:M13 family metallopeptidase [Kofleriaceae bacterium]